MLYLRNHAIKGLAGDIAHFVPEPDPFVAGIVQSPVKRPRWDAEADDGDSSLAADRRGRFFHDEELRWRRRGFFFPGTNRRPARVHENRTPVTRSQGPPQSPVASRGGAFLFGNLTSGSIWASLIGFSPVRLTPPADASQLGVKKARLGRGTWRGVGRHRR